jgi:hypothetical protein
LTREAALKTTALSARLMFANGRTVVAAERVGFALGVAVMTFGLILQRMLFERLLPSPA